MRFSVEWGPVGDGRVVVRVHGEVDLAAEEQLRRALAAALDGGSATRAIVVDLGDVTFLDCAGVRVLMQARSAAAQRTVALSVRDPGPMVECVLRLVGAAAPLGLPTAQASPADRCRHRAG